MNAFTLNPRRWLLLAGLAMGVSATLPAAAQTPNTGPIRLIVPFTPGTGIDLIARTVGPQLAERLGRPVVVDNRPGASGNIGTEAVVRAPADGSTLLVSVNTLVMNRSTVPQPALRSTEGLDACGAYQLGSVGAGDPSAHRIQDGG